MVSAPQPPDREAPDAIELAAASDGEVDQLRQALAGGAGAVSLDALCRALGRDPCDRAAQAYVRAWMVGLVVARKAVRVGVDLWRRPDAEET